MQYGTNLKLIILPLKVACQLNGFPSHCLTPAGFEYYEASAKENINVRQVFERLVDIICVKMSERVDVEAPVAPGTKTTKLTDKPAQLPQKCC